MIHLSLLHRFLAIGLLAPVSAFAFFGKDKTEQANTDFNLPPYEGVKHAIAVVEPDYQSSYRPSIDLGSSVRNMLESALYDTERFIVVERESLDSTIEEQDLATSGRAAAGSDVARTGFIRNAKYLAKVTITDVAEATSGGSGGIGFGGFRIGGSTGKAEINMIVSIIDSTTTEIVAKQRIEGEAGRKGLNFGYVGSNWGGDLGGFTKTPLGEAAYDCVVQATRFIALEMEDFKLDGRVVTVTDDNRVVLNRGSDFRIQPGMVFSIREEGELLTDPSTGAVLERIEGRVISEIRITKVSDKISYAELVEGELPKRGDVVTLTGGI